MTNESGFWRYLQKGMAPVWDASRHENMIEEGTPDVSYGLSGVNGWIELKHLDEWPKRSSTKVRIYHFTRAQKSWLINRGNTGGHCWLFLKVGKGRRAHYLLFYHNDVHYIYKGLTKEAMLDKCYVHWEGVIIWKDLQAALLL